jgi:hypothetical protein
VVSTLCNLAIYSIGKAKVFIRIGWNRGSHFLPRYCKQSIGFLVCISVQMHAWLGLAWLCPPSSRKAGKIPDYVLISLGGGAAVQYGQRQNEAKWPDNAQVTRRVKKLTVLIVKEMKSWIDER